MTGPTVVVSLTDSSKSSKHPVPVVLHPLPDGGKVQQNVLQVVQDIVIVHSLALTTHGEKETGCFEMS